MPEIEAYHIWLGEFPSDDARYVYFLEDEDYDSDNPEAFLSQFARDQGENWYDHDWFEVGWFEHQDMANSIKGFSHSERWYSQVMEVIAQLSDMEANTFVMIKEDEIPTPCSVEKEGMKLIFLGTF